MIDFCTHTFAIAAFAHTLLPLRLELFFSGALANQGQARELTLALAFVRDR